MTNGTNTITYDDIDAPDQFRSFIQAGGHQLQLNAVDADTLRDAQAHPELHRGLIVRVWGWSAYFIELDRDYQDQVIQRVELTV